MIELKDINYITGTKNDIQIGGSKIFTFIDVSGKNFLLLSHDNFDSGLFSWTQYSKKKFSNLSDTFEKILQENLFRVDYLIVDIYHSCTFLGIREYESRIRKITKIPIIFIIQIDQKVDLDESRKESFVNKISRDSYFYIISKSKQESKSYSVWQPAAVTDFGQQSDLALATYQVRSVFEKWESTLKDLKLSYIRDKKLEELFKEDDENLG